MFCSYKQEKCVYSVKQLEDEIAKLLHLNVPDYHRIAEESKENVSGRIRKILIDKTGICMRQVSYNMECS